MNNTGAAKKMSLTVTRYEAEPEFPEAEHYDEFCAAQVAALYPGFEVECGFGDKTQAHVDGADLDGRDLEREVSSMLKIDLWDQFCEEGYKAYVTTTTTETECAYCGATNIERPVPGVDDDATWAALASEHLANCEWVATRAHRLDTTAKTTRRSFLAWAAATGTTVGQLMQHYDGRIGKYGDPTEGGREGLSYDEAMEVMREDASLLYVDLTAEEEAEQLRLEARAAEEANV